MNSRPAFLTHLRYRFALALCTLADWIGPDFDEDGELEQVVEDYQTEAALATLGEFADDPHWRVLPNGCPVYVVEVSNN